MTAWLFLLASTFLALPAQAAGVEFTVQADRTQIAQDDSVSLKFSVKTDGPSSFEGPFFNAPEFEVVNEYTGTFVESYYENGRFGMRHNRQFTKVLRALRTGTFRISNLSVRVNGQLYKASDITVQVTPGGAGTPPPRGYGGGGLGLRGSGKRLSGSGFFVRAEVDKQRAYKGEQLIVSYYLYRRVRVFNIQVDKYPTLSGFLREDLEMPVLGQRLDSEQVLLDGVPYERSLLVRYAAYPLKDGKLPIDSIAIKASYYGGGAGGGDEDDPFMTFFQQMAPKMGTSKSDVFNVDVVPLPEQGRPPSFTGGVGDFTMTAAVDKYEVKANEALTLTVKVEGRGNTSAIEEPKAKWPSTVELYESKGKARSGKGGVGEKIFEFLLIPRAAGKLEIPSLELAYFDPQKKDYVTRRTDPFQIQVGEGAPGSAPQRPMLSSRSANPGGGGDKVAPELSYLKPPGGSQVAAMSMLQGKPIWRWLYLLSVAGFLAFAGLVVNDRMDRKARGAAAQREAEQLAESKSWATLRTSARQVTQGAPWKDVTAAYERLSGAVYDAIDRAHDVGARSLSRGELKRILVEERGVPAALWEKASRILEFAEMVRFASSAGAVTEAAARNQLNQWVTEGQSFEEALRRSTHTPA